MDGAVTEHYHFILFKIWGWNGQKLRFCVDGSLKRRTKRGLQKHPDTSGWGLNRKAGREIIAPSVPSFPYFSSNDFCRPLSPSDGRLSWVDHHVTVKMVPGQNGCPSYLFRADPLLFNWSVCVAPPSRMPVVLLMAFHLLSIAGGERAATVGTNYRFHEGLPVIHRGKPPQN